MARNASRICAKDSRLGSSGSDDSSSQPLCTYCASTVHSARVSSRLFSHFRRIISSVSVGWASKDVVSRRSSIWFSIALSNSDLATSDIDMVSPRASENCLRARSKKSRTPSEMRIDKVCCWPFLSLNISISLRTPRWPNPNTVNLQLQVRIDTHIESCIIHDRLASAGGHASNREHPVGPLLPSPTIQSTPLRA